MSTAIGLRDQRLRLYERREEGADGFSRPVFYFVGEWWGRIDVANAGTRALADGNAMVSGVALVALFSDEVPVPKSGVLRNGDDMYFINGVQPVRALRRVIVTLDALTPEQMQLLKTYDVEPSLGTHVVDPF